MADDPKNPIDQVLDLFVYAPLGLALFARDQLPSLIERGRAQVAQQTTLARMMGQYAAKEGERQLRERLERFAAPASPPAPPAPAAPAAADAPEAPAATNGRAERAPEPADAPAAAKPSGEHLAIPGYDTLSASQIVQRLPGLDPAELEAVRAYEEAARGRRTILTKISQLQSESTS